MKIEDICARLELEVPVSGDQSVDITEAIAGDLLSFIMGRAIPGSLLLTIQVHLNVAAVAVLKDMPMIILTSGRKPAKDLEEKCREENICLACTSRSTFATVTELAGLGLNG